MIFIKNEYGDHIISAGKDQVIKIWNVNKLYTNTNDDSNNDFSNSHKNNKPI